MKPFYFIAAILIAGTTAVSSYAADEKSGTVIVTATRTAQTADDTLASVTVITASDIERQQATSVQDLLRGTVGLGISNSGGPGKATSFFLRGSESDQVLVLINGVKVGSATLGTTPFQDIPIDQIERIEIVRGPGSSLYGSEAIGGVIQIFTKKGGGAFKPRFTFGAGSHNSKKAQISVSGGGKKSWFHIGASHFSTSGFNACNGIPVPFSGCGTFEPDKDGYENNSGSFRAGHRFHSGVKLEAHGLRSRNETEFDGTFVNETETRQRVVGGKLKIPATRHWHVSLDAGVSNDDSKNFLNGVFATRFDTRRTSVSMQHDVTIGDQHLITLGSDYLKDEIESTTVFPVTSRTNRGDFVQYQGQFKKHRLLLSTRHDDNEQFGNKTTGKIGWGFAFNKDLRVMASYGTGFKAPTFNQLYFPFFGNPNLVPENSRSTEVGLKGKAGWGQWSINAYETRVDDLITSDPFTFLAVNLNKARLRGIEIITTTRFLGWQFKGQLTLQDPENRSAGANKGNVLVRRAKQQLRLDFDGRIKKWDIGFTLFAEGRRYDDLANTRELEGYATVDFRAGVQINKTVRFQAKIGNLFDKEYETAQLFNQDGRNYLFTIRFSPGKE